MARFGERAQAAVPILEEWFDDEQDYVRIAAAEAIGKIDDSKIPQVMPVLLEGLKSAVRIDRLSAVEAIRELSPGNETAIN